MRWFCGIAIGVFLLSGCGGSDGDGGGLAEIEPTETPLVTPTLTPTAEPSPVPSEVPSPTSEPPTPEPPSPTPTPEPTPDPLQWPVEDGRFGVPQQTYTLPGPSASGGLYVIDVQASYPEVDWQTLDRLYIPAGHYKFIRLGNLPQRTPEDPLIITNINTLIGHIWTPHKNQVKSAFPN